MSVKMLRHIAGLLAVIMLAGCVSGEPVPEQPQVTLPQQGQESSPDEAEGEAMSHLKVAYDEGSTLNPYNTGSTQNYYLSRLLYDSLIKIDDEYNTNNCLADSVTMSVGQMVVEEVEGEQEDETETVSYTQTLCDITLRDGVTFWNGDPLTADDVVYSLYQAMASPYYAAGLTHVMRVTSNQDDPLKLSIVLSRPDAFFEHSLTFPIVQEGSGLEDTPMGSGRYRLATEDTLVANSAHFSAMSNITTVEMVDVLDIDSAGYSIKTGLIDIAFSDLRTSSWNRSLGNGFTAVQLSNMVYLGVNKSEGIMANAELRSMLSRLIDRSELTNSAYSGLDSPVWLPFHPQAPTNNEVVQLEEQLSIVQAGLLLDDMGYDARDTQGYRLMAGRRMSLNILVNNENSSRVHLANLIAARCEEVGIDVSVLSVPFAEYEYYLSEGGYDIFVGEVKLPMNMNILPMLGGVGETSVGAWSSLALQEAVRVFLETGDGYEQVYDLFSQETPFIPLLFRRGIMIYPLNFSSNILATEQDIFYNIEQWDITR